MDSVMDSLLKRNTQHTPARDSRVEFWRAYQSLDRNIVSLGGSMNDESVSIRRRAQEFDCAACHSRTAHEVRTIEGLTASVKVCGHCNYLTFNRLEEPARSALDELLDTIVSEESTGGCI